MLEWHHRELGEAARAARFDQHVLSVEPMAGHEFFANLKASYDRSNAQGLQRATLLSPEALRALLGPAAHRDAVAWPATPGEREYRAVVESESRYVAALDGRALHFLIDRDRVALAIARETIRAR